MAAKIVEVGSDCMANIGNMVLGARGCGLCLRKGSWVLASDFVEDLRSGVISLV